MRKDIDGLHHRIEGLKRSLASAILINIQYVQLISTFLSLVLTQGYFANTREEMGSRILVFTEATISTPKK